MVAVVLRPPWSPGRRVDAESALSELSAAGYVLVATVRAFLAEYSDLTVASNDGCRIIRIDGHEAALHADPDWCSAYAQGIGRAI